MRLIDVDSSVESIRNLMGNGATLEQAIDAQPTAYDVDKVVEQLESEAERWRQSGKEYQDQNELGVAAGYQYVIKIVKAGGANE